MRKVPELLAEQVEAANVILINKKDLAGPDQVKVASALARSMNKDAEMEEVEYGRVRPITILRQIPNDVTDESSCADSDCTDTSHSHSHDDHAASCDDPDCTDSSHSHSHEDSASCEDPDCTDASHSHSHEDSASCEDPDCTDTSHAHEHSHSHASTSTEQLGITNFVYTADRPFNTKKLLALLNRWPVPIKDDLDLSLLKEAQEGGYEIEGENQEPSPFTGVLRSKGFCWFAPTRWDGNNEDVWRHDTAMYWSHAGKHFGISTAGKWWGTIGKDQMKKYFKADMEECERIIKEDFVTEEFGDRRQEIVFIGVGIDQEEISHSLDQCLVTEKGMKRYKQELSNYMNSIMTVPASNGGLFDVGGYDNLDV
jgi:G3E family GTPase